MEYWLGVETYERRIRVCSTYGKVLYRRFRCPDEGAGVQMALGVRCQRGLTRGSHTPIRPILSAAPDEADRQLAAVQLQQHGPHEPGVLRCHDCRKETAELMLWAKYAPLPQQCSTQPLQLSTPRTPSNCYVLRRRRPGAP